MSTTETELPYLAQARTDLTAEEVSRLEALLSEWTLISDLAFADLLLWLPTWNEAGFVVAGQIRPATARSHIHDDLVGHFAPRGRHFELDRAFASGTITNGAPTESHAVTQAIPVKFGERTIAVLGRYSGASQTGRLEEVYEKCVTDLLNMVTLGEFPRPNDNDQGTGGRGGAPRVGDGLMILDQKGRIEYASPNARSAFRRLGFSIDLENHSLSELVSKLNRRGVPINDTLSLVARGRIQATAELHSGKSAATLRSIPITSNGTQTSTLVLVRDVTDLRRREQALLGKDAAIREVHHRVKNNLQTVASLLRLQGRRLTDESARIAIAEAGRRVATIAVVHDLLAHNPGDLVDFDEVAQRVVRLTIEAGLPVEVDLRMNFNFGRLPTDQATPFALILAELVSNCLEHAAKGRNQVAIEIKATSNSNSYQLSVCDDGPGIEPNQDLEKGIGIPIVTTLVKDELNGNIRFMPNPGLAKNTGEFNQGTCIEIEVPKLN